MSTFRCFEGGDATWAAVTLVRDTAYAFAACVVIEPANGGWSVLITPATKDVERFARWLKRRDRRDVLEGKRKELMRHWHARGRRRENKRAMAKLEEQIAKCGSFASWRSPEEASAMAIIMRGAAHFRKASL